MNPRLAPGLLRPALLYLLLAAGAAFSQTRNTTISQLDRAEALSSSDSAAALQLLDKIEARDGDALVQWLMVRGLAYADTQDEEQARAVIRRLHELAATQAHAEAASHIVQAWLFSQNDHIDRAEAELKSVGAEEKLPAFERFRLQLVHGTVLKYTGRHEAALSVCEQALDTAYAMHSVPRVAEAMITLSSVLILSGNPDRAAVQLREARSVAEQIGDEALLVLISSQEAAVADRRRDRVAEHSALLEALAHAKSVGSDKLMWQISSDLCDYYMKTGDYAVSLGYAKQALALARKLQRRGFEQISRFNLGMVRIGLGQLAPGKRLVESVIQQALAGGNPVAADELMGEYLPVLEHAGDLRGALEVLHRDEKLREQVMTAAREKALLELSAKFDDERRARQIELLKRDNAIKSGELQAQRLHQQMIVMAATLIALTCAALAWGISRIRNINARLIYNRQHDVLTGLPNRRYFNENILPQHGDRPYLGCLLVIDLDQRKHINDALGSAACDAVLAAIGERLAGVLRDDGVLVSWAGDEFLAMLGLMSQTELNRTADQLLHAVRSQPVEHDGAALACTISIGCAGFPLTGSTIDVSLERAIALVGNALSQAKREGGDRLCLVARATVTGEQEWLSINTHLAKAAAENRARGAESG
jgi:diguanylate cyclase (GGDEF)-like protein